MRNYIASTRLIACSDEAQRMRDRDVRQALLRMLEHQHQGDRDTSIVEEMGIWSGSARIDVVVINGELTGFELKSERDTLARLPDQVSIYGLVFDRVYLVATDRHLRKAKYIIPNWWGTLIAKTDISGKVELKRGRMAKFNRTIDPLILSKLLWKNEAIEILDRHGSVKGLASKSVGILHQKVSIELTLDVLRKEIRSALKKRAGWLGQVDTNALDMSIDTDPDPFL